MLFVLHLHSRVTKPHRASPQPNRHPHRFRRIQSASLSDMGGLRQLCHSQPESIVSRPRISASSPAPSPLSLELDPSLGLCAVCSGKQGRLSLYLSRGLRLPGPFPSCPPKGSYPFPDRLSSSGSCALPLPKPGTPVPATMHFTESSG